MNTGAIQLRAAMRARSLTIEAASKLVGLPYASGVLNQILMAKRLPTLKLAARLKEEFGIPPEDFTRKIVEKGAA